MNPGNPLKDKLDRGEVVFGCFIPESSPLVVEILALAGFDFVLIDGEHGMVTAESAYPMILAAESRGITAVARVGETDKQVLLKYLDVGAAGIMVPQVNDVETARRAIAATKYWPKGTRGLAGGRTFDFGLAGPAPDYVAPLNDRAMTLIQFEHIAALPAVDAILDLPDLDVLFIGPNDLAQSMGFPGQPGHPEVAAIADQVVAKAKVKGVKVGTTAGDGPAARRTVERGFDMIVTNSPGLLSQAARAFVTDGRG